MWNTLQKGQLLLNFCLLDIGQFGLQIQHTINQTFHKNVFPNSCSDEMVRRRIYRWQTWYPCYRRITVIHLKPHSQQPQVTLQSIFLMCQTCLNPMASPLRSKPLFTAARWLNLQNADHTYLKLTKFCGGNFWHVLHKSWSFLSWSCTLRKKNYL